MIHGLTQGEASAMFGVSRATWIRWEDGRIGYPLILAMALKAFDFVNKY
jgi:DNA-binding XRE family transcriptional regulator